MSNIQKQHKISPAIAWLTIQKFIIFYCPLDGEHTTSHEKLTAIADLFEVPVDYLLNDEEDTITLSPSRLTTNSDDELNLLLAYRSLSRSSKRDLKKYMKLLKEKDASESS